MVFNEIFYEFDPSSELVLNTTDGATQEMCVFFKNETVYEFDLS